MQARIGRLKNGSSLSGAVEEERDSDGARFVADKYMPDMQSASRTIGQDRFGIQGAHGRM
jgi:hypothetical protein